MVSPPPKLDEQAATEGWSLLATLGLAEGGANGAVDWYSRNFLHIAQLWPLILLAKLWFAMLVNPSFFFTRAMFSPWLVLTVAMDGAVIASSRLDYFSRQPPHLRKWLLLPLIFLSALGFSLWFPGVAGSADRLTPLAGLGMVALAAYIFGERGLLAVVWVLGALAGWIMTGASPATIGLGLGVGAAMLIGTLHQAVVDRDDAIARYQLDLRSQRSDRLLRDYEASGHGWFWETDRHGSLVFLSETLDQAFGQPLLGRPIATILGHGEGKKQLGFHLSARTGFADIAVQAAIVGEDRWWSISGQPVFSAFGQFQGFRGSGTDLTEMRRSQAEVERLALYDSLTGLANRVHLQRALGQAITGPPGKPGACTLLMLDLDRFKFVNDTMGHPAGDALLRQVSQRLSQVVGGEGLVARQGGDEFSILLPGQHNRSWVEQLAQAIIDTVSEPYQIEISQVVIGVSVGISACPDDGVTKDALVRNADLALYAAKGAGRGVWRRYAPGMHSEAEDRRLLEDDLRRALTSNSLHLVYQPVVSAGDEWIVGYEALLRWNHPERGEISPSLFIPIAEESGLIGPIGEWVIRTACQDAATWAEGLFVAVNVSPVQFTGAAFPATVMSALASAQLAAGRLELEVTESVFLNYTAETDAMFARLKLMGVRLVLDDFGAGYSSLNYLKNAPFDKIKIDQGFVRGSAVKNSRNSTIIRAIISMADALGMHTTAEGVEMQDELTLVRQLGCSHVQGYVYGRPLSAAEILARGNGGGGIARPAGFRATRAPRRAIFRAINIHYHGKIYSGRIRNVSEGGAMIEGLWNMPVGAWVAFELTDDQFVSAIVRWSTEDRMGVEFAGLINQSAFPQPERGTG